jgi:dUTPase
MVQFYVCGNTKPPKRRDGEDAGFDIFIPNLSEQFVKDLIEKNPGQPTKWGIVGAGDPESDDKNAGFYIQLGPHQDILIPSYVKSKFPPSWALRATNKGSVAIRQHLIVGAELIDSSYRGIIYIHLINTSPINQFIGFGQKMCQLVPIRIDEAPAEIFYDKSIDEFKEFKNLTDEESFFSDAPPSSRGEGAFGSTGAKD